MSYNYELWFRGERVYGFKRKKDLINYWEKYKEDNNIKGEKALIKRVEIIPFRGQI